ARLAQTKHKAFTEKNTLATEKERMNELLGRDIRTPFRVQTVPDAAVLAVNPDTAVDQALARSPDVRAAELKLQDAQLGYKVKKSEYVPEINLELRYTKLYNVELIPDELATIGVHGRWEFYDWGRKRRELAERSASITQAENDQRQVEAQVAIEVRERIRKVTEERERVGVAELQQKAAREKLRVLMNQYRVKTALLKDVLQAQSELEDATNAYEHAVLSLWTARAELQKALGEE
ncbi:MAG: TolC family protein, partial [Acidiferrobacterales bacterium]|nr:TolC family protein [Acidiferrobacterales bacterium]